MYVYKLTAKNNVGSIVGNNRIPRGAVIQVISNSNTPSGKEISQAIKNQLGIEIPQTSCSSGNFIVERMK